MAAIASTVLSPCPNQNWRGNDRQNVSRKNVLRPWIDHFRKAGASSRTRCAHGLRIEVFREKRAESLSLVRYGPRLILQPKRLAQGHVPGQSHRDESD